MEIIERLSAISVDIGSQSSDESVGIYAVPVDDLAYKMLLGKCGGLLVFDGALHIFGRSRAPIWNDVSHWNEESGWRREYAGLIDKTWWFFAETAFGDQFFFNQHGMVCKMLAETAHVVEVASSFEDWVKVILANPDLHLDLLLVREWCLKSGVRLRGGEHICPQIPFCLGGGLESPIDGYINNSFDDMIFKGQLAFQLSSLKPGDKVNLRTVNRPVPPK